MSDSALRPFAALSFASLSSEARSITVLEHDVRAFAARPSRVRESALHFEGGAKRVSAVVWSHARVDCAVWSDMCGDMRMCVRMCVRVVMGMPKRMAMWASAKVAHQVSKHGAPRCSSKANGLGHMPLDQDGRSRAREGGGS